MKLKFKKMHGCGNDYIYFNCVKYGEFENPNQLAMVLSRRNFSIGADGIVLICKSEVADFKMRMFNADGSEGKMCGNAIRCVAKFVCDDGMINSNSIKIETLSGVKTVLVERKNGLVVAATVNMGPVSLQPSSIPISGNFEKPLIGHELQIGEQVFKVTCVSMGNPHCVVFVNNLDDVNLFELGPKFEKSDFFVNGINTEFVEVLSSTKLAMKVWERGSGATLACGTGACAAVVAGVLNGFCELNSNVTVSLPGGELVVKRTKETVFLTGNAVLAYSGIVEI